ncbi:hypothetical protein TYRP_012043 [Tyrophagus putrescentiae]|nr:hypothetical protein TYRP_012043 [Tyrophagus putrescentiae]
MAQKKSTYTWRRFAALLAVLVNILLCLLTIISLDYFVYIAANEPYNEITLNNITGDPVSATFFIGEIAMGLSMAAVSITTMFELVVHLLGLFAIVCASIWPARIYAFLLASATFGFALCACFSDFFIIFVLRLLASTILVILYCNSFRKQKVKPFSTLIPSSLLEGKTEVKHL